MVIDLAAFLRKLDDSNISDHLDRVRDAVMVVVAVPGERWKVEFMDEPQHALESRSARGHVIAPTEAHAPTVPARPDWISLAKGLRTS